MFSRRLAMIVFLFFNPVSAMFAEDLPTESVQISSQEIQSAKDQLRRDEEILLRDGWVPIDSPTELVALAGKLAANSKANIESVGWIEYERVDVEISEHLDEHGKATERSGSPVITVRDEIHHYANPFKTYAFLSRSRKPGTLQLSWSGWNGTEEWSFRLNAPILRPHATTPPTYSLFRQFSNFTLGPLDSFCNVSTHLAKRTSEDSIQQLKTPPRSLWNVFQTSPLSAIVRYARADPAEHQAQGLVYRHYRRGRHLALTLAAVQPGRDRVSSHLSIADERGFSLSHRDSMPGRRWFELDESAVFEEIIDYSGKTIFLPVQYTLLLNPASVPNPEEGSTTTTFCTESFFHYCSVNRPVIDSGGRFTQDAVAKDAGIRIALGRPITEADRVRTLGTCVSLADGSTFDDATIILGAERNTLAIIAELDRLNAETLARLGTRIPFLSEAESTDDRMIRSWFPVPGDQPTP